MKADTELAGRLSAAFEARTSAVTAESLRPPASLEATDLATPPATRGSAGTRSRWHWGAPLLAAAAVVAVVVGTVTALHLGSDGQKPARIPPAHSQLRHPGIPSAAGPDLARSAVPWGAVGTGWTLVLWGRTSFTGRQLLYLVSPGGAHYLLMLLPKDAELLGWSPTGRSALTSAAGGVRNVDLRTGAEHRLALPAMSEVDGYASSDGSSILVSSSNGHQVWRYGIDGQRQLAYPQSTGISAPLSTPGLATPDFSGVVAGTAAGVALYNQTGGRVRAASAPTGYRACGPRLWWSANTVELTCMTSASAVNAFLWRTSTGTMTQLTHGPTKVNPFGYSAAWRYARGMLGLAPNGCGPDSLVTLNSSGRGRFAEVTRPIGAAPGSLMYVGHSGDRVSMVDQARQCGSDQATLISYDAADATSRLLVGATPAGGAVRDAEPWYSDR